MSKHEDRYYVTDDAGEQSKAQSPKSSALRSKLGAIVTATIAFALGTALLTPAIASFNNSDQAIAEDLTPSIVTTTTTDSADPIVAVDPIVTQSFSTDDEEDDADETEGLDADDVSFTPGTKSFESHHEHEHDHFAPGSSDHDDDEDDD